MKNYKIKSFIYLCFFISVSAFYQSLEVQREFENNTTHTEIAKNKFEDAAADIKNLELQTIK